MTPVEPEIDLVTLSSGEWRVLLQAAAELDLVHGGYYRSRPGAVLFFAGPDNSPVGWSRDYPDGSPHLPRAAVGQADLYGFEGTETVTVRLSVSNWGAMRAVKQAYDRGEYRGRFEQFLRDQEAALRGRPEDRRWVREQFHRLRAYAHGTLISGLEQT